MEYLEVDDETVWIDEEETEVNQDCKFLSFTDWLTHISPSVLTLNKFSNGRFLEDDWFVEFDVYHQSDARIEPTTARWEAQTLPLCYAITLDGPIDE